MIIRVLIAIIIIRRRGISQCGEEDNVYYNVWGREKGREAKPVYFHRLGYSHWMFGLSENRYNGIE